MGGFECSTQRLRDGQRLDMIAATQHDEFAASDYRTLAGLGIRTVREGVRWHLVEATPLRYDFSSVLGMMQAARQTGTQVIWDLFHYGWPDDIDIFAPEFVSRLASFAGAFAAVFREETDDLCFVCPVNETSFVSWAGGDVGYLNPFAHGRGPEIKRQLVCAAIEAIEALRSVIPGIRLVHCEPAIHIVGRSDEMEDAEAAESYRLSQFEALDMLSGQKNPELGGKAEYLDIIGVNYYSNNQRTNSGETLYPFHPRYRPLGAILKEFHDRYQRPVLVSETGIEGNLRPSWLGYIGAEVRNAVAAGVPVEGICLYPIVNHPGWDDRRHCLNGLLDYPPLADGTRAIFEPLARELRVQQQSFARLAAGESKAERFHP